MNRKHTEAQTNDHTHVTHSIRIVKDFTTIGYWNGHGINSAEITTFPIDDLRGELLRAKEACMKRYSPGVEAQIVQIKTDVIEL